MNELLSEAERLHALGFAVHWLRPNSKIPLEGGWTKGTRSPLKELKAKYRPAYNAGVRLGKASHVAGAYLAVVDVDIKSDLPKHRAEAESALFRLFPACKAGPYLLSGRGNGSAHYYVRVKEPTSKDEVKAQSKDIVKVSIPSVSTNEREELELTFEEQIAGIRLRPAWEISLLSEGRQSVLVHSVHPDTGAAYKWGKAVNGSGYDIPLLEDVPKGLKGGAEAPKEEKSEVTPRREWNFREVDLTTLGLRDEQLTALSTGKGVSDRSAKVYELCLAMLSRGIDEETIVSVLTDKQFYLGQTAYAHAKTNNRRKAARWIENYSLVKARKKIGASDFDIEELPEGLPADSTLREKDRKQKAKQRGEVPREILWPIGFSEDPTSWERELELKRIKGEPRPVVKACYTNLRLILANSCERANFLKFDQFSLRGTYTCNTPWGKRAGEERSAGDEDASLVKSWLNDKYNMEPSLSLIEEMLNSEINHNGYHPLKDYLESLTWDGIERVSTAFKTYMGAIMPEPYLSAVTRKFFVGCIKRVFEPGCTFQYMVVLEGKQGIGKSTFAQTLASKQWFLDKLPSLHDKDAALVLLGTWIAELSELAVLTRTGNETAKAFITSDTDRFRPPYGKRRVDFPRTTVFLGTTNLKDYLSDPTGNRRYWPVHVTQCDFKALERDRDQLWAEAMFLYQFAPENLYLSGTAKAQAEAIQSERRSDDEGDVMEYKLQAWEIEGDDGEPVPTEFTIAYLFEGPLSSFRMEQKNLNRVGQVLRKLGYVKIHTKRGNMWTKEVKEKHPRK